MPLFGYARVSTRDQDLATQNTELMAAGCAKRQAHSPQADHLGHRLGGAFSSEVDTGSRKENASKQKSRAPF